MHIRAAVFAGPAANFSTFILTTNMNDRTMSSFQLATKWRRAEGSMDDRSTDVIQGTLDMLILKSLSLEPMHGYGIARRIEQISKGVFKVNPGSLMLAFKRMERAGLIDSDWRPTENNRRGKFYRLTDKGRKELKSETREWERRTAAISRLLEA